MIPVQPSCILETHPWGESPQVVRQLPHLTSIQAFYLLAIENHQGHLAEAERHGCHQHSDSPQPIPEGNPNHEDLEDIPPPKQAKPDDLKFPWTISDFIHGAMLSPSLSKSLELLELYAINPKGTKQSLINSPSCPKFPDSEWTTSKPG